MSDISGVNNGINGSNGSNGSNGTNGINSKIDIPELTPLFITDNNQNCISKYKKQWKINCKWKCNMFNMTEIDYLFAVLLAAGIGITFYIVYKA